MESSPHATQKTCRVRKTPVPEKYFTGRCQVGKAAQIDEASSCCWSSSDCKLVFLAVGAVTVKGQYVVLGGGRVKVLALGCLG
jgi:hypothetical protein